jgi:hypothetical protein
LAAGWYVYGNKLMPVTSSETLDVLELNPLKVMVQLPALEVMQAPGAPSLHLAASLAPASGCSLPSCTTMVTLAFHVEPDFAEDPAMLQI